MADRPDKLDRVEQAANLAIATAYESPTFPALAPSVVVDAKLAADMVRVARAARALTGKPFGQLQQRDFFLLREALAELEADK